MITHNFLSVLSERFSVLDFNLFIINFVLAVILLGVGIFLGKFIKFLAGKIIEQSGISRTTKKSFVELFLVVIKWSIYLLFISLALDQLGIPQLTSWISSAIVVIPALVGALLILGIGFVMAVYLRDLIEESDILEKKILGAIFFYFILYVFMIFAIKTALISQDRSTINTLIIILTAVISAGVAYWHVRK